MLKIILLTFLFFFLNTNAKANCLKKYDFDKYNEIKKLEIDVINKKKWLKVLLASWGNISDKKRKQKHKGNLKVYYKSGIICNHKVSIRIHGDTIDHRDTIGNWPISSIRVKLEEGNINNITRFKLLIPISRYSHNEIFVTTVLRHLNIIAPKTFFINLEMFGKKATYLFQESLKKELIESFNKVEGPIVEDKELFKKPSILQMSRISNKEWAKEDFVKIDTSFKSIEDMNTLFLTNYPYSWLFDKTNDELLKFNQDYFRNSEVNEINAYDALMFGMGSIHSLSKNDRRFYYDPIYSNFIPIYYDGMSKILSKIGYDYEKRSFGNTNLKNEINPINFNLNKKLSNKEITENPFPTLSAIIGAREATKKILKIDRAKLYKELRKNNLDNISKEDLDKIILEIKLRLNQLSLQEIVNKEYFFEKSIYSKYKKKMNFKEDLKLIFSKNKKKNKEYDYFKNFREFEICDYNLIKCEIKKIDIKELKLILEQKPIKDLSDYIFIGKSKAEYQQGKIKRSDHLFNEGKIVNVEKNFKLYLNEFVKSEIDNNNKIINLFFLNNKARAVIYDSNVLSWKINIRNESKKNNNINYYNLTGCLTILDSFFNNLEIKAEKLSCEDSVNFIRSKGNVRRLSINSSLSDGLDGDFSDIKFNYIQIKSAHNDCIDLSFGNYFIESANLKNCKDKAISVGERSTLKIIKLDAENSKYGIVSKDQSNIFLKKGYFKNVSYCLAAYKKKQEFNGSIIKYKEINCERGNPIFADKNSEIIKTLN